jgi:ABC-type transporter Mla subunit MlaD
MDPTVVAAWIAAGVSALTLVGTLTAQYLSYRAASRDAEKAEKAAERVAEEQRKQLDSTLAEQREQLDRTLAEQNRQLDRTLAEQRIRTLNERFATAARQLGDDKPPAVRLAGVYAMAGLADDWAENRQTCVDVLCAYLRMPYEPDPGQDAPSQIGWPFRPAVKSATLL